MNEELIITITQFHVFFPSHKFSLQSHQDLGLLTWLPTSTSSSCGVERRDPLSDLVVIAQGKHSQALEVLPVKVLERFVDTFLTVPHSKWSKRGDTQQTFPSIHSVISITKTGLSELRVLLWGSRLSYSCYIFSVFHRCDTVLTLSSPSQALSLFCCLPEVLGGIPAAPHNLAAGTAHTRQKPGSSAKDYASEAGEAQKPAACRCPESLAASPVNARFTSPDTATCLDCVG